MPTTSTPSADARGGRGALWLWGPALAALLVRLALYAAGGVWTVQPAELPAHGDAAEYHVLAVSLVEDGRFRFDRDDPVGRLRQVRWEVEPLRTPGYPAFVAAFYAAVGPRPGVPIAAQLLLEAATCLLLAWALRGALGTRGAALAALTYALHPGAALFANILYSEALFAFLAVAGFGFLVWAMKADDARGRRGWRIASAGFLFGLAALVRPVLLFLPIGLAIYLIIAVRPWRRAAIIGTVFAAAFAIPVLPWAARNSARHGHFAVSTSGAFNLLTMYAAPAEAATTGRPATEVIDDRLALADAAARARGPVNSDFDRAPAWRAEAREVVAAYPGSFLRQQAVGVVRLFASTGRMYRPFVIDAAGERPPADGGPAAVARWWAAQPLSDMLLDVWLLLYALAVYPLLAVGAATAWQQGVLKRAALGLAIMMSLYLIILTGTPGHSRFMAPIIPFLAPFAALGAERVLRRDRR